MVDKFTGKTRKTNWTCCEESVLETEEHALKFCQMSGLLWLFRTVRLAMGARDGRG